MRIAVAGTRQDEDAGVVRVHLVWSDEPEVFESDEDHERGYRLTGTTELVERAERATSRNRRVMGRLASLTEPHHAYRTMVAVIREYGGVHTPIDFAATDDDGMPIEFIAEPDADSLLHHPPGAGVPG